MYFSEGRHSLASTVHSRGQRGVTKTSHWAGSQEARRAFRSIQQILFFIYLSLHHYWWQGQKNLQMCLLKPFREGHERQSGGAGESSLEILWLRTGPTHGGHIFVKDCIQEGRQHQCHLVCRELRGGVTFQRSEIPAHWMPQLHLVLTTSEFHYLYFTA